MQQEHTAAVKMSQTLFDLIYPKLIPRRGFVADLDVKEKKNQTGTTWNEKVMKFNFEGNNFGMLAIQNFKMETYYL